MSKNKKEKYLDKYVHVALFAEDLEKLQAGMRNSTCRSLSEYCRGLLLGEPITLFYRDQSFDAFIEEAIVLRKEMRSLREELPFTDEGEQRLIALEGEIKLCINKIFDHVRQNTAQ